jgi:hypothetical protein
MVVSSWSSLPANATASRDDVANSTRSGVRAATAESSPELNSAVVTHDAIVRDVMGVVLLGE